MKLNDIQKNLKRKIDIQNDEIILKADELKNSNNIDSIKNDLEKSIKIRTEEKIRISNNGKIVVKDISEDKKSILNLKKELKNQTKIKDKAINIISKIFIFKKVKYSKDKILKILSLFILIFIVLFINKIVIQNLVYSWIKNLYNSRSSHNIGTLEDNLSKAKTKFNIANILFSPFKILPQQKVINAKNWIYSLNKISKLWLEWVNIYRDSKDLLEKKAINEIYFTNLLLSIKPFLEKSEKELYKINNTLSNIKLDNESENYKKLEEIKNTSDLISNKLQLLNKNYDTLLEILWKGELKKYFIVFQNNDEIRPTWWFMWSAWIIEIFDWKVNNIKKRDIYAYEWDVNKNYNEKVTPTSWINMLSERLWLRDSNSFINFETSAKSINYFMKKWWYELDWVIFINQKIIIDILSNLDPIDFWKYDTKITHKNFSEVISFLVEAKVSKKATLDTPKQVLFDFYPVLKNEIIKKWAYSKVLKSVLNSIGSRDIAIIIFNKQENEFLKKLDLTWNFKHSNYSDFNYPFFISVGWNKSDRYIERGYNKYITIEKNNNNSCDLKSNLQINLKNIFSEKDRQRIIWLMKRFRINENIDLINISWAGENRNFTKVVIPKNAILDHKELIKNWYQVIDHNIYKTVEKLISTKPWENSYFEFDYIIENIDCISNDFKIFKQAWIYDYDIKFNTNNKWEKKEIKVNWLNKDFNYNLKD